MAVSIRATKIEQRQKHDVLYSGKSPVIVPGATYYLVPSSWLNQWRAYLGASGKNVLSVEEPNGLEAMLLSLICVKVVDTSVSSSNTSWLLLFDIGAHNPGYIVQHERLAHKPPLLCRTRRGDFVQRISNV